MPYGASLVSVSNGSSGIFTGSRKYTDINRIFVMKDVTPLSDAYILDIITAHLSTAGIHQTIMFLVALADMGETRRCRIRLINVFVW